jgi:hypothetical protein
MVTILLGLWYNRLYFFKSIEASNSSGAGGPHNCVYIIVIVLFLLYASFSFIQLYEYL